MDRFGNLITNIDRRSFDRLARLGGRLHIRVGQADVGRLVSTYAEVPAGEVCALFGSSDHLEIRGQQRQRRRAADAAGDRRGRHASVGRERAGRAA